MLECHLHVGTSDSEPTTTLRTGLRAQNPGEALDLTSIVFQQYANGGGREATYALYTSVDEFWAAIMPAVLGRCHRNLNTVPEIGSSL